MGKKLTIFEVEISLVSKWNTINADDVRALSHEYNAGDYHVLLFRRFNLLDRFF